MKKITLLVFLSLTLISCVNEKKEYTNRLNQLIGTDFDYNDERITIEQEQDFSSLVTSITVPLTSLEKQQILNNNKSNFKYYETKVDSLVLKGFSYDIEYDQSRESININLKNDSDILSYTNYKN